MSTPSWLMLFLCFAPLGAQGPTMQMQEARSPVMAKRNLVEPRVVDRREAPSGIEPQSTRPAEARSVQSPRPCWATHRNRLEDLILTLASDPDWEQLTLAACAAYPELREDFHRLHPAVSSRTSNAIRASRERYRLRHFVTEAALNDYRDHQRRE